MEWFVDSVNMRRGPLISLFFSILKLRNLWSCRFKFFRQGLGRDIFCQHGVSYKSGWGMFDQSFVRHFDGSYCGVTAPLVSFPSIFMFNFLIIFFFFWFFLNFKDYFLSVITSLFLFNKCSENQSWWIWKFCSMIQWRSLRLHIQQKTNFVVW